MGGAHAACASASASAAAAAPAPAPAPAPAAAAAAVLSMNAAGFTFRTVKLLSHITCPSIALVGAASMANLFTKILDVRGSDSSGVFILRGGIIMSVGHFPEMLSRRVLVNNLFNNIHLVPFKGTKVVGTIMILLIIS